MALSSINDVEIDADGVFKYIMIRLKNKNVENESKIVIRGNARCDYHSDIFEEFEKQTKSHSNLSSTCLGGGRIAHDSENKSLRIYGYSQGYGKADHNLTAKLLKERYPNYNITWTDEGY